MSMILVLLLLLLSHRQVASFSVSLLADQVASTTALEPSSPFGEWISDSVDEVTEWKELVVQGRIPSYLNGCLVRNGGGIWSVGDSSYSHIFDGLAKVSAWRINQGGKESSSVQYRNQFIQSQLYKTATRRQQIPVTITAGPPPAGGMLAALQAIVNSPGMDNAPVNIWDFDPETMMTNHHHCIKKIITARTDAPARASLSVDDLSTQSTFGALGPPVTGLNGVVILETAHPLYEINSSSSETKNIATYNVATVFIMPSGRLEIAVICERPNGTRSMVASSPPKQGNVPYIHSFGIVADRYVICILQPLRLDIMDMSAILKLGFLRAMKQVPQTEVMVFDLQKQKLVFHECTNEKIFFYHAVSSSATNGSDDGSEGIVSVRLCAYRNADMITGEHHFLRLDQARKGAEFRNQIPKGGTFCDITANLDTKSLAVQWINEIEQGFELPTTRYSREYRNSSVGHPRYVYAYGAYANGSPNYDDWGLFKYDLQEKKIAASFVQPLMFPSEPIFVPNPEGTSEDDGVVLTQIYDGTKKETGLFVLDGATMKIMATVWSGHRSPMDFHGGWVNFGMGSLLLEEERNGP